MTRYDDGDEEEVPEHRLKHLKHFQAAPGHDTRQAPNAAAAAAAQARAAQARAAQARTANAAARSEGGSRVDENPRSSGSPSGGGVTSRETWSIGQEVNSLFSEGKPPQSDRNRNPNHLTLTPNP